MVNKITWGHSIVIYTRDWEKLLRHCMILAAQCVCVLFVCGHSLTLLGEVCIFTKDVSPPLLSVPDMPFNLSFRSHQLQDFVSWVMQDQSNSFLTIFRCRSDFGTMDHHSICMMFGVQNCRVYKAGYFADSGTITFNQQPIMVTWINLPWNDVCWCTDVETPCDTWWFRFDCEMFANAAHAKDGRSKSVNKSLMMKQFFYDYGHGQFTADEPLKAGLQITSDRDDQWSSTKGHRCDLYYPDRLPSITLDTWQLLFADVYVCMHCIDNISSQTCTLVIKG